MFNKLVCCRGYMKKIFIIFAILGAFMVGFIHANIQKKEPTIIILMGPPGSGKGTHAVELSKMLKIPHISTGDIFRENLTKDTPIGKKAKSFIEKGQLVPDEIVNEMLFDRLKKTDCEKGYILDGYPRNLEQAYSLEKNIKNISPIILDLKISDSILIERITNRLICSNCGAVFNKLFSPPKKNGICDYCQNNLYQRKDDKESVIKKRLTIYHKETSPLIDYYKEKDFHQIAADRKKEKILQELLDIVKETKK